MNTITKNTMNGWMALCLLVGLAGCNKPEPVDTGSTVESDSVDSIPETKGLHDARAEQERIRIEQENIRQQQELDRQKKELAEEKKREREKTEKARLARIEARAAAKGKTLRKLKTITGKEYENVTIREVDPVFMSIRHGTAGLARVRLDELPVSLRRKYGYDREEAREYERKHNRVSDAPDPQPPGAVAPRADAFESGKPPAKKPAKISKSRTRYEITKLNRTIATHEREIASLGRKAAAERSKAKKEWEAYRERKKYNKSSARNLVAKKHEKKAAALEARARQLQAIVDAARDKKSEYEDLLSE